MCAGATIKPERKHVKHTSKNKARTQTAGKNFGRKIFMKYVEFDETRPMDLVLLGRIAIEATNSARRRL